MAKTKKPRLIDTVRYGAELAALKRNKPKQWARLQAVAKRRGVTIPSLVSGAPPSLQERTPAAIRREAAKTVAAAYKPQEAVLSRREKANAALEVSRSAARAQYQAWLDSQVGLLRAQAGAAGVALAKTHTRINDELVQAQAATTQEMARSLAGVTGADPTQSLALAAVPAAQSQGLEKVAASREHSAELQKIGATSTEVANTALLATAAVQTALDRSDANRRNADLSGALTDLGLRKAADTQDLEMQLRQANRETAQGNREFGLAASQLGLKRQELGLDLKKAMLDYKLGRAKFNLEKWIAHNKVKADRLKRKIEYDKIASREGIAAANRALRREIEASKQAGMDRRDDGPGGSSGATAGERKDSRQAYSDIETARAIIAEKLKKGQSERQVRLDMIRNHGASSVVVDVAFDLVRHNGQLSRAGVRRAKNAGVLRPLKLWDLFQYTPSAPVSEKG